MSGYTPSQEAIEAAMNAHTEEANRFKPNELRPVVTPRPTAFYAALAAAVPIELARLVKPLRELADNADHWPPGYDDAVVMADDIRATLDALPGEGGQS